MSPTTTTARRTFARHAILIAALAATATTTSTEVHAADGMLEISQTCSAVGCFPGDAPGLPVTIPEAGSYRLTSNLVLRVGRGDADPRDDAVIVIDADDVHLDLAGFSVRCEDALEGSFCRTGEADGILIGGSRVTIRNGSIVGHAGNGVATSGSRKGLRIVSLNVAENGADGVELGSATFGHIVSDCYVAQNRQYGIHAPNSVIERNRVIANGDDGVAGAYSAIRENVIRENGGDGVSAFGGLVTGNMVWNNGDAGIRAADGNVRFNNVRSINELAIYGSPQQDPCASGGNRAEREGPYGEIYGCGDGGGDVLDLPQ